MNIRRLMVAAVAAVACVFAATNARAAATVTYIVDPTQSSLTLSGTWGGNLLYPQPANGFTTAYGGTITANRDVIPNTLQLTGGSIVAQNNGSVSPLTLSPANYGFDLGNPGIKPGAIEFAITGFSFSLTTPTFVSASTFDVSQIAATISSGEIDYEMTPYPGFGSVIITGPLLLASAPATLVGGSTSETLTIPVNTDFSVLMPPNSLSMNLHLFGDLVAQVPEPSSITLLAMSTVLACRCPRKRRFSR